MSLDIITLGNEILREKSLPVDKFDEELKKTVDEMFVLMKYKSGAGLAAPQVKISKRFFICKIANDCGRVFINPEIIETSQETVELEEGCLSLPGVWANVVRPASVMIQAQDLNGKIFRLNADNWLARVILHEFDHLNGTLFVDRLNDRIKNKVLKKYERINRK